MQQRTTVRLVTSDPALFRTAAVTLGAADYQILNDSLPEAGEPDLIVRHWAETSSQPQFGPVPVLTLDLSLVSGEDLVEVVERVLGRRPAPGLDELHGLLAEFEAATHYSPTAPNPDWRNQN